MIDKLLNSFLQYHGISFEKQVDLKKRRGFIEEVLLPII